MEETDRSSDLVSPRTYSENGAVLTPVPLHYDDTVSTTSIQKVLFVNSGAVPLETHVNTTTFPIVYDSSSSLEDILEVMRRKFSVGPDSLLTRIGFAFHNHGDLTRFCNREAWFSDSDLEENQTVFSPNAQFMLYFLREFKVTHVDYLACKTLQSEKWRKYFKLIQSQTGVIVGASDDDTGNVKYGGDWVQESTMEDVREVYFTSAIENYASLLSSALTIVANLGKHNDSLTILGDYMYTFAGTKIYKIDLRTNAVSDFYNQGNTTLIRAMCAHGDFLYFHSGNNSIGKLNLSNGSIVSLTWITGLNAPWGIVTDGTYLYITNYLSGGYIVRIPLATGGAAPAPWITGLSYPWRLCIYGSHLYLNGSNARIRKYNLSNGSLVTADLTGSAVAGVPIWAHNSYIYVAMVRFDNVSHGITQAKLDGTAVNPSFFVRSERLLTPDYSYYTHTNDMAVYNNRLYCASYDYGYVFYIDNLPPLPTVAPLISNRPTASASITYPATIGSVSLTGGTALSAVGGTAVPGVFSISSTISSSVFNAGTYTDVLATFAPTDTGAFSTISTSVPSITVLKATPFLSARPTSATTIYPNKLSAIVVTGGSCTVTNGGAALTGTFVIHPDLSNSVFAVGTYQDVSAVFVPTSSNYGPINTTIPTLTVTQVSTAQLASIGVSVTDLKTAGYSATELKTAGFTATQQKSAGFTAAQLKTAGYNASEQKTAGVTAADLKTAGFTATEQKNAGFTTPELKTAGYQPTELMTAGITAASLYQIFTTPTETKSVTKAVVSDILASTSKTTVPLSTLVGYTFDPLVTSVVAVKVTDVNTPIVVSRSELLSGAAAVYAVLDVSSSYIEIPTWYSSIRVMNVGGEKYRIYDSKGTKVLYDNLLLGDTRTHDGLTVVIGSVTATFAPPPTVNFVLTGLNSAFTLSSSSEIPNYQPASLMTDATITLSQGVSASDLQNTFFYRTDNPITTDASFVYYYVDTTKWSNQSTILNPKNGIVTAGGYVSNDNGSKDFLRDLARQLFGTYLAADLFTNEDAVVTDINLKFDTVASNVVALLTSIDKTSGSLSSMSTDEFGKKYLKDNTSTSNISRELFNQLITSAPARFVDIKTTHLYNSVEDGFYKMPIMPGDKITFKVTISPSASQVAAVPTGLTSMTSRSYTVILNVT